MHRLVRAASSSLCRYSLSHVRYNKPILLSSFQFQRFNSSKDDKDLIDEYDEFEDPDKLFEDFDEMINLNMDFTSKVDTSNDFSELVGNTKEQNSNESMLADIAESDINQQEPQNVSKDSDFDLLNSFINDEYSTPEDELNNLDFKDLLDSLNVNNETPTLGDFDSLANLTTKNLQKQKDLKPFDVDEDETIFDYDFLGNGDDGKRAAMNKVIDSEQLLFQKIFDQHLEPESKQEQAKKVRAWDVQDSLAMASSNIDKLIQESRVHINKISKVSLQFRFQMFAKTKVALAPSLEHVSSMNNCQDLIKFFDKLSHDWEHDGFYLLEEMQDSSSINATHLDLIDRIAKSSQKDPTNPQLNIFTFPILFNKVLETITYKFNDNQLALSLFNILKTDVKAYTFACNQETFNQILKLYWIFNGKSSLYNIEMVYLEMTNNGFGGDVATFNILKQIVIDYHRLKMGTSNINEDTSLPIWCKEDDRRVYSLEGKLHKLANTLRAEGYNREAIPIGRDLN